MDTEPLKVFVSIEPISLQIVKLELFVNVGIFYDLLIKGYLCKKINLESNTIYVLLTPISPLLITVNDVEVEMCL